MIALNFDRWYGYVKDYDYVTLMECIMHSEVDCFNVPVMLKAQKMASVEELNEKSSRHRCLPSNRLLTMLFLVFARSSHGRCS